MGVFGSPGFDEPGRLLEALGRCDRLRTWAGSRGLILNEPDSLTVLDQQLDAWSAEPEIGTILANEVGAYVGTVIVNNCPGATWTAWPNGHPVVRLISGTDLDVTDTKSIAASRPIPAPSPRSTPTPHEDRRADPRKR